MALRWGFKTWANKVATETRREVGLGPYERLDPRQLAAYLGIPIIALSEVRNTAPVVEHLMLVERDVFSAATIFSGVRRIIVHNDSHSPTRQSSNLSHELSHGLLGHPPTPALDDMGCRIWNQDIEDEAAWLGAALLVPECAALAIARRRWTQTEAAHRFGVSPQMIQYRLNVTGAEKRTRGIRAYQSVGATRR